MSDQLRIVHLYPRELGINGDLGNVITLVTRARWRGISVAVHNVNQGEGLPEDADLIHIGSGPLSAQRAVYSHVRRIAADLRAAADAGVPVLAIAGGWQLLGRSLRTPAGEELPGAGVFTSSAVLGDQRTVGELIVTAGHNGGGESLTLAGFENHSATTTLEDGAQPLGLVIKGGGNTPSAAADTRAEGIRTGDRIGTHLHGSFLPMNPAVADQLLRAALRRHGDDSAWPESDAVRTVDGYAARARSAIANRLGVRG